MEKREKLEAYYSDNHQFREAINILRELALKTESVEAFKWNFPVYTVNGKNVFGICKFKNHFGVWFFNGSFLSDPKKVLSNAQEGKTKGMRHWKFNTLEAIDNDGVRAYMTEAIENQKQGLEIIPDKSNKVVVLPPLLQSALEASASLTQAFQGLSPYKRKEFCEYIAEAKQEKTKARRLEKILPMIQKGIGLHDAYR